MAEAKSAKRIFASKYLKFYFWPEASLGAFSFAALSHFSEVSKEQLIGSFPAWLKSRLFRFFSSFRSKLDFLLNLFFFCQILKLAELVPRLLMHWMISRKSNQKCQSYSDLAQIGRLWRPNCRLWSSFCILSELVRALEGLLKWVRKNSSAPWN